MGPGSLLTAPSKTRASRCKEAAFRSSLLGRQQEEVTFREGKKGDRAESECGKRRLKLEEEGVQGDSSGLPETERSSTQHQKPNLGGRTWSEQA